jgi:lipopolysaccharide biosynthesis protein
VQQEKTRRKKRTRRSIKHAARRKLIKNQRLYLLVSDAKRTIKSISPRRRAEVEAASRQYDANAVSIRQIKRISRKQLAVVIHLYYVESWELFRIALENLKVPFDLFVTLPNENASFTKEILKNYSDAHVFEVPNLGRDVLPFLRIAQELEPLGYKFVLKIHSKKSPHRKDGNKWLKELVSSLLPNSRIVMEELMELLEKENTGVIGPKRQYISLMVNFPSNGPRIAEAISNIYSPKITDKFIRNRRQYGFFAGTMFWARLDAIKPILDRKLKVSRFDSEKGQIDATFAHAIERVFCLVPQIEKKNLYEIGPRGVNKIDYKTTNIPNWSDVYIGPKPDRKKRRKR